MTTVPFDLQGLLRLWTEPLPEDDSAEDAFRALQRTSEAPEREILDTVEADGKVAVAFRLRGLQVGPLATSAGQLAPAGRQLTLRVIDILTIADGVVTDVWMVADELGALDAADAVQLLQPASP
jgi:hypothetical protein